MGSLDDYTIIRELGQDGLIRRAIARGASGLVLLRVLEPVTAVIGEAAASRAVQAFQASATLQSKAHQHSESAVCPVVDFGAAGSGGAFVASGGVGTTWGDLAAGRVRLDGATIRHLVCRLLESAAAFAEGQGRGHGRIGSATVAIHPPEVLLVAQVRLDDPDASRAASEADDALAIGALIFELVEHRAFERRLMLAEPEGAWSVFGSAAPGWLALVADLCHASEGARPSLREALSRAEGLRGVRRGGRRTPLAIGAALLLAGAGGVGWWAAVREPAVVVDEFGLSAEAGERWRRLCEGWDGWFGAMVDAAERLRPVADDHLRSGVLDALDEASRAGVTLDPGAIVGQRGRASLLAERPPEAASEAAAIERTARAVEVLSAIEDATGPERWPLAREALDASASLETLGWSEAGARLRSLVEAAGASRDADRAQAVLELAEARDSIRLVAGMRARLGSASEVASGTGDPVLGELAAAMGAPGRASGSLENAWREAEAWASIAERLERAISTRWSEVDAEALRTHAAIYTGEGRASMTPTEVAERWLVTVQEERFTRLDQAHPAIAIGVMLDATRAAASEIGTPAGRLRDSIEAAGERVRALRDRAWNRITRADVESAAAGVRGEVVALAAAVEDARWAGEIDATAYAAEIAGRPAPTGVASATLDALWVRERDRLVAESQGSGGSLALRDGIRRLSSILELLESRFPLVPVAALPAGADGAAFHAEAGELRERAIADAVSTAELRGRTMGREDVERLIRAVAAAYAGTVGEAEALLSDVGGVEVAMDTLRGAPASAGLEAIESRGAALGLAGTIAPVLERARRIGAIGRSEDVPELVRLAGSDARASAFAAYVRLGELGWPRETDALRQDAALRPRLRALAESVGEPPARDEALQTLAAAGAERWRRFTELAGDEARVRAAGSLREAMGGRSETLSARARGNLASVALLDAARSATDDAGVREAVREFVGALAAADEREPESEAARRVRAARALLVMEDEGPGASPVRMGPGAAPVRWSGEAEAGHALVRFEVPGGEGLFVAFAPVRVGDGVVYLSTEEVSLELLSAGAAWAEGWDALATRQVWPALMQARAASTPPLWEGARGWSWQEGGLRASPGWVAPRPVFGGIPLIAPALVEAERSRASDAGRAFRGEGGGGAPSMRHPVQSIPGPAASAFAEMIGCRLPTSAEWRAAAAAQEPVEAGDVFANLRDATWATQWRHASGQTPEIAAYLRPDRESFAPGEAQSVVDADDGVLYFEPVNRSSQSPFRHLVGNVAEFVRTPDGGLGVIGGSAMSVPGEAGAVTTLTGARARAAYADVGFRLAFDAPGVRVRRPLRVEVISLLGDRVVEPPSSGG
ncbi:MAG: hypothetical protein EA378_04800 [Phycisphaerales bacterium]|nr:MAG: hypothetical protein EA378_04800 [Phycisphaerales bacterium]